MTDPCRHTLFHLSDIHFGLEDRHALQWVQRQIDARQPDAIIVTGDLTMRARHREFAAASRWIRALDRPVTVEIGNHDLPYFNPVERFFTPYKRFSALSALIDREIDLPGLAVVPLKTVRRWQPRLNWSKGWITHAALDRCLAAIDALPAGTRVLVAAHHPLREAGTRGTALTMHGRNALSRLARRPVVAVLSGHVHDPFDITDQTEAGPVRMIGAGTLSHRIRSTPASFNELTWDGERLLLAVRTMAGLDTPEMQVDAVPENALPPREPDQPVAPVGHVPPVDPPVH